MWLRSELVTPAATALISLADAKAHLRVDHLDEDDYITSLVSVAQEQAESICARRFGAQSWKLYFDSFVGLKLLGCGTVASVTTHWRDSAGAWQLLSADDYELVKTLPARFFYRSGFREPEFGDFAERVRVDVLCGESLPESVRAWMLLRIGTLYENREADSDRPVAPQMFVPTLLAAHRVIDFS